MLSGSLRPSPLPSMAQFAQVDGMNCIGPTARSYVRSPSCTPLSVSRISAKPTPSRAGPRIGVSVVPRASTRPPAACPDSTLPIAASSCHGSRQPGSLRRKDRSAFRYAASTVAGIPASDRARANSGSDGSTAARGGFSGAGGRGLSSGGSSVW
ncbi:hypothetical protein SCYAM73S_03916 [Streptomyces cyaneofuscatus]